MLSPNRTASYLRMVRWIPTLDFVPSVGYIYDGCARNGADNREPT